MNAINHFAKLISEAPQEHSAEAIDISRKALVDTIACAFSGSNTPVAKRSYQAVASWGSGDAQIIGQNDNSSPPFAAMINAAAAHAQDYDDFDEPANSHPSAVIFPALLALASTRICSGRDLLDAHIIGVEVMQRLGEAMNMDHYRRGWLSTLTLGSIGAAAACARLLQLDYSVAASALSISASMASGLTNQGGYLTKQLHPGLAAKNGIMAASLAMAGITGSDQVIDGDISLARCMGDYQPQKFKDAMDKLGDPWSILEHGLMMKVYPTCGYTHRVIDAAIDIHPQLPSDTSRIRKIEISVPDYYLDLLIYPAPGNTAEAMFSAEYNVITALLTGSFKLTDLEHEAIFDSERVRLLALTTVVARTPRDSNIVYDPLDPDSVEVTLEDNSKFRIEAGSITGSSIKPMNAQACRTKFNECLAAHKSTATADEFWNLLERFDELGDIGSVLAGFSAE